MSLEEMNPTAEGQTETGNAPPTQEPPQEINFESFVLGISPEFDEEQKGFLKKDLENDKNFFEKHKSKFSPEEVKEWQTGLKEKYQGFFKNQSEQIESLKKAEELRQTEIKNTYISFGLEGETAEVETAKFIRENPNLNLFLEKNPSAIKDPNFLKFVLSERKDKQKLHQTFGGTAQIDIKAKVNELRDLVFNNRASDEQKAQLQQLEQQLKQLNK